MGLVKEFRGLYVEKENKKAPHFKRGYIVGNIMNYLV